jgi:hypothetical protein
MKLSDKIKEHIELNNVELRNYKTTELEKIMLNTFNDVIQSYLSEIEKLETLNEEMIDALKDMVNFKELL